MTSSKSKVVLISGGTNGIGRSTALELSKLGFIVCIIGRSVEKCRSTSEQMMAQTGNKIDWICSDLSTLEGIYSAAYAFIERYDQLNILINNAGAYFNKKIITQDGYEKTFALNHLNYFLLTNLLLDILQTSSPARIINVSSITHHVVKHVDFGNLHGEKNYSGWRAYCQSKLYNILFTKELSRRVNPEYVTINAMNPGYVSTGFMKNNGLAYNILLSLGGVLLAKAPTKGADTILYMASSDEVSKKTGKYFYNCSESKSSTLSQNKELAMKLWNISKYLTHT